MHDVWSDFIFGSEQPESRIGLRGGDISSSSSAGFEPELIVNPFTFGSYRNFLVMYCSFVDGLDRGIRFPIIYILKTKYLLSQAVAFTAFGVSLSPWLAKPFLALMTDTVPIFGLRRKPYLIGSAAINAASLGLIGAACVTQFGGFLVPMSLMTLRTFCRGITGSVVQGMLLEDCRDGDSDEAVQSRTSVLMSQYHTSHRLGQFLSVCVSGYLISTSSIPAIFVSMAAFHAGSIALAAVLSEPEVPVDARGTLDEIPDKLTELAEVVSDQPAFRSLLEYSFLAMASPTYEARLAYYLLDDRHMDVWALSLVTTAQTIAACITPTVYSILFQNSNLVPLAKNFTIATVPASLLPLVITTGLAAHMGWNEAMIAAGSGFVLTLATDLQMMPANVLVAQLAKKGLEGASFSLFTVSEGLGRVVSNIYSGVVPLALGASAASGYANMSLYVVVASAFQMAPYPTIGGIDDTITTVPRLMPTGIARAKIEEEIDTCVTDDEL